MTAKDAAATSTPKPKEDPKYPNLSPFLQDLAQLYDANELTEEQIAAKAPMYHGPQVFVDIDIVNDLAEHKDLLGASVNRSIVSKWLENEGASPKSVGPEYRPPYIYAWVKVSDLGALSQQPAVTSVTELHDLDGSFAKMVADGNAVLYLPIWVKNDPYERLDYDLAELLYRYKMGEITAQQLAKEYQGHTDGKVLLEIELMSDPVNTAVIVQWLKDEDVTIRAVSKTEQYVNIINARVPVELLEMLAAQPGLYGIRSGYGIPPDTNDVLPRNQNGPPESAHSARNSLSTPVPTPTPVIKQRELEPTSGQNKANIMRAIYELRAGGSTLVEEGLRLAYDMAHYEWDPNRITRVILLSDGVANVGETGAGAILERIQRSVNKGVTLTTVGVGRGDFNEVLMEQLANDGDGAYYYMDTLSEARRIFVDDLTSTLQVIAKDAKIQVDFNPGVVDRYRLLGCENREIADQDFRGRHRGCRRDRVQPQRHCTVRAEAPSRRLGQGWHRAHSLPEPRCQFVHQGGC